MMESLSTFGVALLTPVPIMGALLLGVGGPALAAWAFWIRGPKRRRWFWVGWSVLGVWVVPKVLGYPLPRLWAVSVMAVALACMVIDMGRQIRDHVDTVNRGGQPKS